jgi:hypothetical protein
MTKVLNIVPLIESRPAIDEAAAKRDSVANFFFSGFFLKQFLLV